jgi:hypothetical protein
MEELDDEKLNLNKSLINTISYAINKKMNGYNAKLDNILKKIDYNNNLNVSFIDNLNKTNIQLEEKIKHLEKIILELSKNNLNNHKCLDKIEFLNNTEFSNISEVINNTKSLENTKIEEIQNIKIDNNDKVKIIEKSTKKTKVIKSIINNDLLYKEVKIENIDIDIDNNFLMDCLNSCNINDDIKIFKKIYIDDVSKEYYPIRHIKKKYQYWLDGHMNDDDSNGSYIKNTIIKNIEQCYFKINTCENYPDIEQLLKNQEHINEINEQKYKDKFLLKITSLIDI